MQRHVPTQITRVSRRSPLTPPPTPSAPTSTAKLRFQRLFKIGEAEDLRWSKGWNHSLLVSSLFCIADLQPDWISHPRAHLCANVTLTSLTQRCHSLLAGSLFPICRFYSGRSGKVWWHSCESGFFSYLNDPAFHWGGRNDNSGLFPAGETADVAFGCKLSHYATASSHQLSLISRQHQGCISSPENPPNGVLVHFL